jgi:hypothetical protein
MRRGDVYVLWSNFLKRLTKTGGVLLRDKTADAVLD